MTPSEIEQALFDSLDVIEQIDPDFLIAHNPQYEQYKYYMSYAKGNIIRFVPKLAYGELAAVQQIFISAINFPF